ncbi:hypothetical protein [Actinoplanes aureus]|uniref:Uncharacterized protein n=1 Tax=Actinoplanes aureus TaxID=2792083 RepID=A0A931G7V9_9ACTN|nr:hypothetical protein [Actinoplanes aureus]MBG0568649.1 hypothetical protein [Actinoplanes aureus]
MSARALQLWRLRSVTNVERKGHADAVSDGYIRLIPADKRWQPSPEAAAAATSYVGQLFSGPQDDVEEVKAKFYDQVTLIDDGENTTKISCLNCGGDIDVGWLFDLVEEKAKPSAILTRGAVLWGRCCAGFASLRLAGRVCPFRDLRYESHPSQV